MPILQELCSRGRPAKIILLGSGGLSIGQAGEFDYSGTQALKALREEGIEVIVVNPNIATVQTNPLPGTKIYLYPVDPIWVEKIIKKEQPDAIIAGFGGQTALNCLLALDDNKVLHKYNVIPLGTSPKILRLTEDRDLFAKKMKELGMPVPVSLACDKIEAAVQAAEKIGFPVIIRSAYALGGLGSGFAENKNELIKLVEEALASSPQVLVEKALRGWKEVEYEVMRDGAGNAITICNMENFDPLGIHTGDSIVVAPSQSLSDNEYQLLRNASLKIVKELGIIGECNVQFALDPKSSGFYVIEMNARLSRSSALASKASGYPIAYIAAKVVLGFDLLELKNPVTGVTFAFFEPALDYVTVKIPRWDLVKFRGASRNLGSTMKSVGEVMGIGRTFTEALQKAARMVMEQGQGLSLRWIERSTEELLEDLREATDLRLYIILEALRKKIDIEEIQRLTSIDLWFLARLREIVTLEREISCCHGHSLDQDDEDLLHSVLHNIMAEQWKRWKLTGFGDEQIAGLILQGAKDARVLSEKRIQKASLLVRKYRKLSGIIPVAKKIDTTAGEYPSPSNYLYLTYGGDFDDPGLGQRDEKCAVVLGGGAYRIGTSVEFDWCAVSCSERLRRAGWKSVIINCNPETVSTDYNNSDRLYFEELTLERILDIAERENPTGLISSMGGQLPNKLALPLAEAGLKLLGHDSETIDLAENRRHFSALLDELKIDQPRWIMASSPAEITNFCLTIGFPVLVRPSYVLSGAAMCVAYDQESLDNALTKALDISNDHPVVISEYLTGAREIELDGVARQGEILTAIVSEHIENAGIHSGDATMVVPAQKLYVETIRQVKLAGRLIAKGLKLNGPFNMQFLAKTNKIKVIECNARAARSFPFVSKVVGINLADVATDVIIGEKPNLARFNEDDLPHVGVKAAMFSFTRLRGADPILGVEMASTGEVGCLGPNFEEALLLALLSSGCKIPCKGVLVSSGGEAEKLKFLSSAEKLQELGLPLFATKGTAKYLMEHGFNVTPLDWPGEGQDDVIRAIREGRVDLVINIPKNHQRLELTYGSQIRQTAALFGCTLFTNMEKVSTFVHAWHHCREFLQIGEVRECPMAKNPSVYIHR